MKKSLSILILFVLLLTAAVFPVHADGGTYCIDDGSIVMGEADDEVSIYVEQNGVRSVYPSASLITVTGRNVTANTIFIKNNITVNLILNNVNIQSTPFLTAPLCIDNGETVKITLVGENFLIGGDFMAGLQTSARSTVILDGDGTLTAAGGTDAAGIGGGWRTHTPGADCGSLTLTGSVTVNASGGANGAGIGAGSEGNVKEIIVKGSAKLHAVGGSGAAGIGGGLNGSVRLIQLDSAGEIVATGGVGAAGIGGGDGSAVSNVTVGGSSSLRAYGGEGAAAIGSGKNGSLTTLRLQGASEIRAQGGKNAAAVGLGEGASGTELTVTEEVSVFAVGEAGPGIGCGKDAALENLTIDQNTGISAFGGASSAGIGMSSGSKLNSLTVSGSSVLFAMGGSDGAGIGGGLGTTPGSITLTGLSDTIAIGGIGAAGVGSGYGASYSDITVSSSAVLYAQGGNYGAGIGSGGRDTAEAATPNAKILITDQSKVYAFGGKYGAGIGGGVFSAGAILEISQNAVVSATNEKELLLTVSTTEISVPVPPTVNEDGTVGEPTEEIKTVTTASLSCVNPTGGFATPSDFDLSPYCVDPGDTSRYPAIVYIPSAEQVNSGSKTFRVGSVPSKEAGNGAGCGVEGSTYISGGATLNGIVSDVTLTLSMGDGATDMVISLAKNAVYTLPESVTKTGYTFRGWYADMELTKPVSGTVTVSEDTIIYAAWTAIQVELAEGEINRAFKDSPYLYQFEVSSGSEGTRFTLIEGTLPSGLELSEDGVLSGIPTVAGKFDFVLSYVNSNGTSGTEPVTLNVYANNTYLFRITTGKTGGAGSTAQVMMSFDFKDRFTGETVKTQTVNLTSLLLNYYDDPLQKGETVEIPLVFEPNVGVPENINFFSDSEDGWFCQSVQVIFEGNEMAEAFDKSFSVNAWVGTKDGGGFWSVFFTVIIILAVILIAAGVTFLLLLKYNENFRKFLKNRGFFKSAQTAPKSNLPKKQ